MRGLVSQGDHDSEDENQGLIGREFIFLDGFEDKSGAKQSLRGINEHPR